MIHVLYHRCLIVFIVCFTILAQIDTGDQSYLLSPSMYLDSIQSQRKNNRLEYTGGAGPQYTMIALDMTHIREAYTDYFRIENLSISMPHHNDIELVHFAGGLTYASIGSKLRIGAAGGGVILKEFVKEIKSDIFDYKNFLTLLVYMGKGGIFIEQVYQWRKITILLGIMSGGGLICFDVYDSIYPVNTNSIDKIDHTFAANFLFGEPYIGVTLSHFKWMSIGFHYTMLTLYSPSGFRHHELGYQSSRFLSWNNTVKINLVFGKTYQSL